MPRHDDVVDTRDVRTIDRFIAHVLSEEFTPTRKPIGWTLRLWLDRQPLHVVSAKYAAVYSGEERAEQEAQRLEAGVHRRLEADTELYDRVMAAIHGVEAAA